MGYKSNFFSGNTFAMFVSYLDIGMLFFSTILSSVLSKKEFFSQEEKNIKITCCMMLVYDTQLRANDKYQKQQQLQKSTITTSTFH